MTRHLQADCLKTWISSEPTICVKQGTYARFNQDTYMYK